MEPRTLVLHGATTVSFKPQVESVLVAQRLAMHDWFNL